MQEIMQFPKVEKQPAPKMVDEKQRDGYTVQKWEAYPLPSAVTTYLVLIPDHLNKKQHSPAVLCIPGSGGTKEALAGEDRFTVHPKYSERDEKNAMALLYVKLGLVAVAVDNAGAGEASDLEKITGQWNYCNYIIMIYSQKV